MLHCIISYVILYHIVLYYNTSYQIILDHIIAYYTIAYYTILYHTTILYTILYYTILYYTILYYIISYFILLYHIIYICIDALYGTSVFSQEVSSWPLGADIKFSSKCGSKSLVIWWILMCIGSKHLSKQASRKIKKIWLHMAVPWHSDFLIFGNASVQWVSTCSNSRTLWSNSAVNGYPLVN